MTLRHQQAERIRILNDLFRQAGPMQEQRGEWFLTPGVGELGPWFIRRAMEAVGTFGEFDSANDPYGEHDFGAFRVMDEQCFWKIDYYDVRVEAGSPDPSDPAVTTRVLTIMLASEY